MPTKKKQPLNTIFADPTYDVTFKMLFGNDANKDILISLLNHLLDFDSTSKEIIEVEINSSDLQKDSATGVKGAVDVLCTTASGKKIAVEMQRQYKKYFLARVQEYMAQIMSVQVQSGQSAKYHEALLDTYVLSIGKQNIFRGEYALPGLESDIMFEKTVKPCIMETGKPVPGNKMHWKFYELPRFAKIHKHGTIDSSSSLKLQWLDFLRNCHQETQVPDNISKIIKKGYEIMKVANWSNDQRIFYLHQKSTEYHEQQEFMSLQERAKEEGREEGRKERDAEIKAANSRAKAAEAKAETAKAEAEAKAETAKAEAEAERKEAVKVLLGFGVPDEDILERMSKLTPEQLKNIKSEPSEGHNPTTSDSHSAFDSATSSREHNLVNPNIESQQTRPLQPSLNGTNETAAGPTSTQETQLVKDTSDSETPSENVAIFSHSFDAEPTSEQEIRPSGDSSDSSDSSDSADNVVG